MQKNDCLKVKVLIEFAAAAANFENGVVTADADPRRATVPKDHIRTHSAAVSVCGGETFEIFEPGSKNTSVRNEETYGRSGARAKHFVIQALGLSPHMRPAH